MLMAHASAVTTQMVLLMVVMLLPVMLLVVLMLVFVIHIHLHVTLMSSPVHHHLLRLRMPLTVNAVWIVRCGL